MVPAHPDLEPKSQHMAATWEDMNSPGRTENSSEKPEAFTLCGTWWLGEYTFLLGRPIFQGYAGFSEGNKEKDHS